MKVITREWQNQIGSFKTKMQRDKLFGKKILYVMVELLKYLLRATEQMLHVQFLTVTQKLTWNLSNYKCFS